MIRLKVFIEDSETIVSLQQRIDELQSDLGKLRQQYQDVEFKYINEVKLNLVLTDLLRDHRIPFRKYLDHRKR